MSTHGGFYGPNARPGGAPNLTIDMRLTDLKATVSEFLNTHSDELAMFIKETCDAVLTVETVQTAIAATLKRDLDDMVRNIVREGLDQLRRRLKEQVATFLLDSGREVEAALKEQVEDILERQTASVLMECHHPIRSWMIVRQGQERLVTCKICLNVLTPEEVANPRRPGG